MVAHRGDMTVGEVLGELTFISYAVNRDRSPEISPERWALIYPAAPALEARYQAEKAIERARYAA